MARHIVIAGGGATGVLTALHLVRESRGPIRVTIVEPRERLGEGVAYGTQDEAHLLNVPALGMSAYGDDPHHFVAWSGAATDDFVARRRYADYLRATLRTALSANANVEVRHLRSRAAEIMVEPVALIADDGTSLRADAVVLALGNAAPTRPAWAQRFTSAPLIADPWAEGALDAIASGSRILCVGTGLTFVDVALSLARRGVRVTGVSRHGLLPAVHAPIGALPTPPEVFDSPIDVSRWIRSQADWRAAFAALRPVTQGHWQRFTNQQQAQFLRHARRFWDVHRHRMAASVAEALDEHRRAGLIKIERGDARAHLETGSFDAVVLCTGPDDAALLSAAPLADLAAKGIVTSGPHGMGIATNADTGQVCNQQGRLVDGLYAIGPLRRGTLWESTAIPEIRVEARRLATLLVG